MQELAASVAGDLPSGIRIGFDLAQVSQVAHSLARFGAAYRERLFTPRELAYSQQDDGTCAERLAARFAAKEAVMKALSLAEAGVSWRDIEVVKRASGACSVQLHGRVADIAARAGVTGMVVSLSHDGDYAGAIVAVQFRVPPDNQEVSTSQTHDHHLAAH